MASGTSNQHHRVSRLDYTQTLPPEMFSAAFDYLDQPDVLRAARVSKRWRAAAVEHRQYYRLIYSHTPESNFLSDSLTGHKRFHALLRDARNDTTRIVLCFASRVGRHNPSGLIDMLSNETFPLIVAIFDRIIALHLAVEYPIRVSIFDLLRHTAPILESFSFLFVIPATLVVGLRLVMGSIWRCCRF